MRGVPLDLISLGPLGGIQSLTCASVAPMKLFVNVIINVGRKRYEEILKM